MKKGRRRTETMNQVILKENCPLECRVPPIPFLTLQKRAWNLQVDILLYYYDKKFLQPYKLVQRENNKKKIW